MARWSVKTRMEFDDVQQQIRAKLTNLRVLERFNEMMSDNKKTTVTNLHVSRKIMNCIKDDKQDPSWAGQKGPLFIPASKFNLTPDMRSSGTALERSNARCIFLSGNVVWT